MYKPSIILLQMKFDYSENLCSLNEWYQRKINFQFNTF